MSKIIQPKFVIAGIHYNVTQLNWNEVGEIESLQIGWDVPPKSVMIMKRVENRLDKYHFQNIYNAELTGYLYQPRER